MTAGRPLCAVTTRPSTDLSRNIRNCPFWPVPRTCRSDPSHPIARIVAFLTYEPFFGLKEKPFSLASDPAFFYNSASHRAAFEALDAGIRRREGLIVLSGEIGTGKTTLCRAVLAQLDRK